nr:immunoglobulin heavy chain junction region [Macaca mulatta]MOW45599.1 immunoglobulin heavy chain junction region [Macaca mulatta]MOW45886.1 immunoglobulin heavy chain junction region [Macaca mulatta]MOW46581.1 immunoglobulin heavy chain junction region [Macaca mulatta]MOW47302.1 immunoglobulin heavy chain junction region [Macaca mulatta]
CARDEDAYVYYYNFDYW